MTADRKAALAIFILACAIRFLAIAVWATDDVGLTDQSEYLALAHNIKLHGVFSYGAPHHWGDPGLLDAPGPFLPTAARPPLFPLFVAGLWWGEAPPLFLVRAAHVLMGAGVAVLVYFLALRIFSRRTAVLAGFGMALAPMSAALAASLLTEPLFTFLLTLGIWQWNRENYFIAGILLGFATLTRAILLPVLAAILLLTIAIRFNRSVHAKILLGAVLIIAPWAARNAITQGAFVPVASMGWGANIYLGTYDIPLDAGNPWLTVAKDEQYNAFIRDSPNETVAEQRFMKSSLQMIAADPLRWLVVRVKQYPRLFLSSGYYLLPVIPLSAPAMRIVYGFGSVLFYVLVAWGMIRALPQWREAYPAVLCVLVFCASQFPGVGEERYITQVVPLLMLFAGHAAARLLPFPPGSAATARV